MHKNGIPVIALSVLQSKMQQLYLKETSVRYKMCANTLFITLLLFDAPYS